MYRSFSVCRICAVLVAAAVVAHGADAGRMLTPWGEKVTSGGNEGSATLNFA